MRADQVAERAGGRIRRAVALTPPLIEPGGISGDLGGEWGSGRGGLPLVPDFRTRVFRIRRGRDFGLGRLLDRGVSGGRLLGG